MEPIVGCGDAGMRCQQWHGRSKLNRHDADLIIALHQEHGLSYRTIAEKFEVSKSAVAAIIQGKTWVTTVTQWKHLRHVQKAKDTTA